METCSSMHARSSRIPMQKEALSCFTVQLRGNVALKQKEPKGQICSQTSPRSSTLHLFVQGFFAAVLPIRQHRVKQPYEKRESGLLK